MAAEYTRFARRNGFERALISGHDARSPRTSCRGRGRLRRLDEPTGYACDPT